MASAALGLTSNLSILSVPVYWILCHLPHGYAITVASRGQLGSWDNRNPRAEGLKDALKAKLTSQEYLRYERAEAAHYNSLESFPFFTAAVVLGNFARLPIDDLNNYALGMGVLRTAFIVMYIRTATLAPTWIRTGIWTVMVGWTLRTLFRAGGRLA